MEKYFLALKIFQVIFLCLYSRCRKTKKNENGLKNLKRKNKMNKTLYCDGRSYQNSIRLFNKLQLSEQTPKKWPGN